MESEEKASKRMGRHHQDKTLRMWSKLRMRMTISYVVVSVVSALLVELLLASIFFLVILRLPFLDQGTMDAANGAAQYYALEAALQANGNALDPASTFQPGHPSSLTLPPGVITNNSKASLVALLIAPNGQVLASSDTAHYPVASQAVRL